jgi:putative transposase
LFIDLDQARKLIAAWVTDYNTARPHSSLNYKTPAFYASTLTAPKGVTSAEALAAAG